MWKFKFTILNQILGSILETEFRCFADELIWKIKGQEELWMMPTFLFLATGWVMNRLGPWWEKESKVLLSFLKIKETWYPCGNVKQVFGSTSLKLGKDAHHIGVVPKSMCLDEIA